MKGKILNIQRFCIQDGPGIRTTVFFKGCPLRCSWCHNPESQRVSAELMYDSEKCVGCKRCADVCVCKCHSFEQAGHVFDRDSCIACGACVSPLCDALELVGAEMTVNEVMAQVMRDEIFYRSSGGGITLSGGEPLMQEEFCISLLREAKAQGLNICMETCGFAKMETVEQTALWVDRYLFDIKETDAERHKRFTGVDNRMILENLRILDTLGKSIVLRCLIIPGFNDRDDHFYGIADIANSLENVVHIEVSPYHSMGSSKYERLGREYFVGTDMPTNDEVASYIDKIRRYTDVPVKKA